MPTNIIDAACNNDVNVCINNIQENYPKINSSDYNSDIIPAFCRGAQTINGSTDPSFLTNFGQALTNAGYY
jgi:hypothetical protein